MRKIIPFFILLSIYASSCVVTFVPKYDASITAQVMKAASDTHAMYAALENSTDRSYSTAQPLYQNISNEIVDIIAKETARSKGGSFVTLANNVQFNFLIYEKEHLQKGSISVAEAKLYDKYMSDIWQPLITAENSLKH